MCDFYFFPKCLDPNLTEKQSYVAGNLLSVILVVVRRMVLSCHCCRCFRLAVMSWSVCVQGMALSMGDKINVSQKKNKVEAAK